MQFIRTTADAGSTRCRRFTQISKEDPFEWRLKLEHYLVNHFEEIKSGFIPNICVHLRHLRIPN